MIDDRQEPFGAEIDAALDAERGARPPSGALDRVRSRLLIVPPLHAGDAPPGRPEGATTGSTTTSTSTSTSATTTGAGWLASHALGVAVAAFLAGGFTGAAVVAAIHATRPVPARVVFVDRPVPSSPLSPPLPSSDPVVAPPQRLATASAPPRSPGKGALDDSLSAERIVLDQARAALTSGDATRALASLDAHARRFRKPQLGEEREALAVQALAALGRYDDARARAARLRASSPDSVFLPAVAATLASIP